MSPPFRSLGIDGAKGSLSNRGHVLKTKPDKKRVRGSACHSEGVLSPWGAEIGNAHLFPDTPLFPAGSHQPPRAVDLATVLPSLPGIPWPNSNSCGNVVPVFDGQSPAMCPATHAAADQSFWDDGSHADSDTTATLCYNGTDSQSGPESLPGLIDSESETFSESDDEESHQSLSDDDRPLSDLVGNSQRANRRLRVFDAHGVQLKQR